MKTLLHNRAFRLAYLWPTLMIALLASGRAAARTDSQASIAVVTLFEARMPYALTHALSAAARSRPGALSQDFPYRHYLDSANLLECHTLRDDLQTLDSLYPADVRGNERFFYGIVTDSLAQHLERRFAPDSLAYLQAIIHWADQYSVLAQLEPQRATFFRAVNLFWMKRVSDHLAAMYAHDPDVKYSFGFQHLNQLCRAAKCGVPIKYSDSEKIVNNISSSKWAYLHRKFWYDSSNTVKMAAVGGGLLVLLPYGLLLRERRRRRPVR